MRQNNLPPEPTGSGSDLNGADDLLQQPPPIDDEPLDDAQDQDWDQGDDDGGYDDAQPAAVDQRAATEAESRWEADQRRQQDRQPAPQAQDQPSSMPSIASYFTPQEKEYLDQLQITDPTTANILIADRVQSVKMQRELSAMAQADGAYYAAQATHPEFFAKHGAAVREVLANIPAQQRATPQALNAAAFLALNKGVDVNDPNAFAEAIREAAALLGDSPVQLPRRQPQQPAPHQRPVTPPAQRTPAPGGGPAGAARTRPANNRRENLSPLGNLAAQLGLPASAVRDLDEEGGW